MSKRNRMDDVAYNDDIFEQFVEVLENVRKAENNKNEFIASHMPRLIERNLIKFSINYRELLRNGYDPSDMM